MAFFCPTKHGKSRPATQDSPTTPIFTRHPAQPAASNLRSRPSSKEISSEQKMVSSAGNLEALIRRENSRKQNMDLIDSAADEASRDLIVIQNFQATRSDELSVFRDDRLKELRREGDWIYALDKKTNFQGYVPESVCARYSRGSRKSMDDWELSVRRRAKNDPMGYQGTLMTHQNSNYFEPVDMSLQQSLLTQKINTVADATPFEKTFKGKLVVLFDFQALDENDLQVQKGDVVSLLNDEDPDWFWVSYTDGSGDTCQGFVPSNFTYKYEAISTFADFLAVLQDSRLRQNQTSKMMDSNMLQHQNGYGSVRRTENVNSSAHQNTVNGVLMNSNNSNQAAPCPSFSQPLTVQTDFIQYQRNVNHVHQPPVIPYQNYSVMTLPPNSATHRQNNLDSGGSLKVSNQQMNKQGLNHLNLQANATDPSSICRGPLSNTGESIFQVSQQFVVGEKFDAEAGDQLSVIPGETVFGSIERSSFGANNSQWTWVYSPRVNAEGFIPSTILFQ